MNSSAPCSSSQKSNLVKMGRAKHTIKKLILELKVPSELDAREITGLMNNGLMKKMEKILGEFSRNGETIIINRIELDLGIIEKQMLEERFTESLRDELSHQLSTLSDHLKRHAQSGEFSTESQNARKIPVNHEWVELFAYYLFHGAFPWWAEPISTELLESRLLSIKYLHREAIRQNLMKTLKNPLSRQRMVRQFSDRFNMEMIKEFYPDQLSNISLVLHYIPGLIDKLTGSKKTGGPDEIRYLVMSHLWMHLVQKRENDLLVSSLAATMSQELGFSEAGLIREIPARMLRSESKVLEIRKPAGEPIQDHTFPFEKESPGEYYVDNAGMVLLWPFLEKFFENLGLTRQNAFVSPDAQHRAMLVLHYLATGNQAFDEANFALTKVIAGWPMEHPVNKHFRLSDEENKECQGLLTAVIGHWKALKNTSPEGLRSSFLLRQGILRRKEKGWLLRVEMKSYDVLLEQIPWAYRVVKLPWMPEILFVEW